ncbi:hydrogenase nickel incorporation protein HypB [bacterium]|nr:hydrogenase nickel incorporation protein HypB [bacterium]
MEIKVVSNILKANDAIAEENRRVFKENGVFVVNIMGSPGAGKTSLLLKTIEGLGNDLRIGVIEGDIATTHDAELIQETGVPVVQINTDGACHLDANMIKRALPAFELSNLDLLFIENVGNLVCPAGFKLGESAKVAVLSVPEGDDKPKKYPAIFGIADAVILNKIDTLSVFDFDVASFREDVLSIKEKTEIFKVSCKSREGLSSWINWLKNNKKNCIFFKKHGSLDFDREEHESHELTNATNY